MRVFAFAVLAMTFGALLAGCGDSDTTEPQLTVDDTIYWVGMSVVYDTTAVKKDRSAVFVLASWCGWCNKLKRETLKNPEVVRLLNESFNSVALDPDSDTLVAYQDTAVTSAYLCGTILGIRGYPTILYLDHAGVVLTSTTGYRDAATLLKELAAIRDYQPGKTTDQTSYMHPTEDRE